MPRAYDSLQAAYVAAQAALVAIVQPRPYDRSITRMTITGPAGSRFGFYAGLVIDPIFLRSTTNLGARNTANLGASEQWSPLLVEANTSALAVWTSGAVGPAATAHIILDYQWSLPGEGSSG